MKKLISLFSVCLIFLITTLSSTSVSAKEIKSNQVNGNQVNQQKTNEYDLVKNLKSMSDTELRQKGISNSDIKKIRDLDLKKLLYERLLQDDEHLKKLGYSDERISELKKAKSKVNFDKRAKLKINPDEDTDIITNLNKNEEEMMMRMASAQLWLSSELSSVEWNTFRNWSIKFWWQWTEKPVFVETDIIGVGWQASNRSGSSAPAYFKNSSSCTISYDKNGSTTNKNVSIKGFSSNASIQIPMLLGPTGSSASMNKGWAKSGSGHIDVYNNGGLSLLEMKFTYGHSTMSVTPEIKLSSDGLGFEIKNSWAVTEEDTTRHIYNEFGQVE